MSEVNDTSADGSSFTGTEFSISFRARFWLFLLSNILSMLCSLFVLYHLLFTRTLRQSLNNHTIIILLIINFIYELTDMSCILHYYRLEGLWETTSILAQFWTFSDYGFYTTQTIIFTWSTVERHILIFHDRWLARKNKRFLLHYLPLIILLLYCMVFYTLVIFYPFCEFLNYQVPLNGVPIPCTYLNPTLAQYDVILHQIIPTFIIIIASIGLLVRVVRQKMRLGRSIQRRKQRKLTIQVLSISMLYFVFQFPWTFFQFFELVGIPVDSGGDALKYTYFFGYYVGFLFPFVCCVSLPELRKKMKRLISGNRQHRTIMPESLQRNDFEQTNR